MTEAWGCWQTLGVAPILHSGSEDLWECGEHRAGSEVLTEVDLQYKYRALLFRFCKIATEIPKCFQ